MIRKGLLCVKDNKLLFMGIYVVQYTVIYGILFALNRMFGLEVSQHAFSIPMFITVIVTGVPLFYILHQLEKNSKFIFVLSIVHYFIISTFLNIIMGG